MKKLNIKSSKLLALKENIRMRVIGLGWEELSTHWPNNGKAFTLEDIASHLKMINKSNRPRSIPTKPPVLLPVQKALPKLGTQAPDVVSMDADLIEIRD